MCTENVNVVLLKSFASFVIQRSCDGNRAHNIQYRPNGKYSSCTQQCVPNAYAIANRLTL